MISSRSLVDRCGVGACILAVEIAVLGLIFENAVHVVKLHICNTLHGEVFNRYRVQMIRPRARADERPPTWPKSSSERFIELVRADDTKAVWHSRRGACACSHAIVLVPGALTPRLAWQFADSAVEMTFVFEHYAD